MTTERDNMTPPSPLRKHHQLAGAIFLPCPPPGDTDPAAAIELVATFGDLEHEYTALRSASAILDQPHRAVLSVTGDDRLAFLSSMLTQDLSKLQPGDTTDSFWLNRKGRVVADLRLLLLEDSLLLDLHAHAATATTESLDAYIILDDVNILPAHDRWRRLSLQGPAASDSLARAADQADSSAIQTLAPNHSITTKLADTQIIIDRHDTAGVPGFELFIPPESFESVYKALTDASAAPIGWHAYNMGRIEAGLPLHLVDFGPDSLPAETGLISSRVSFTKGCYLGQEIVARMHSLGAPKQQLVALRFDTPIRAEAEAATGDAILSLDADNHKPIGAVTSATISPALEGECICFAQVAKPHHEPGSRVRIDTSEGPLPAQVQPQLAFISSD